MDFPDSDDPIRAIVNDSSMGENEKRALIESLGRDPEEAFNLYRLRPYILSVPHIIGSEVLLHEIENSGEKWESYVQYLQEEAARKDFSPEEQIISIDDSTNRILPYLRKSVETGRPTYGLVVGDVQSGKTANFCGLVSKASDAGVSLVIVLSGITNVLRDQTQIRIDRAFGRLGRNQKSKGWVHLTSSDERIEYPLRDGGVNIKIKSGDFNERNIQDLDFPLIMESGITSVIVTKKRPAPLQRLDAWLRRNSDLLSSRQILIIDDESDSASVNTARPIDDQQHTGLDIDNAEATLINELIRSCISISSHSIYVGYTATPYAALLSDPWEHSDRLGYSLYPRDFIVSLPQPTEHNGTTEFFSEIGYLRNQVMIIPRDEVDLVNEDSPEFVPKTLIDSIMDFCISGAIKLGKVENFHHSMLVHCNILRTNHHALESLIRDIVAEMKERYSQVRFGLYRTEIYNDFKQRWESEFTIPASEEDSMDRLMKEFWNRYSVIDGVRSINSSVPDPEDDELYEISSRLDYDEVEHGLWVIAVGGTILSRGLTVEGLTTSFFTRETPLYDTLTQMARWYGYHGENSSLIRVRVSDQIYRWFGWIYQVESRIREDIIRYENMENVDPLTLAPRILRYVETIPLEWEDVPRDFLPTRRGAMATAERRGAGYSGTYFSSRYLPLDNTEQLEQNQQSLMSLLSSVGDSPENWSSISGGFISRVEHGIIRDFIARFNHEPGPRGMRTDEVIEYIDGRVADGELLNWSIAVMSPGDSRETQLDFSETGLTGVNLTRRGRLPNGSFDEIMDKMHVAADLPGYPDEYRARTSIRLSAREDRSPDQGLLLLYVLDPDYQPSGDSSRGFVGIFDEGQNPTEVVAFGLALPDSPRALEEMSEQQEYWSPRGVSGHV